MHGPQGSLAIARNSFGATSLHRGAAASQAGAAEPCESRHEDDRWRRHFHSSFSRPPHNRPLFHVLKNPGAGPKRHGVPVNRSASSTRAVQTRENLYRLWRAASATKAYDALAAAPLILGYGSSGGRLVPALAAKLQSARA